MACGPDVLSIRYICEGMGHYLGLEPIFERQPGEPTDLIADISAMRKFLHKPYRKLFESFDDIDF